MRYCNSYDAIGINKSYELNISLFTFVFRPIFARRNDQLFRGEIPTKLFRHKTIFNFRVKNFSVIIAKNKQNVYNNITVLFKIKLFITFENVISH